MALKLSMVIQAIDKATAPLRKVREAVSRVGRATGLDRVGKALGGVGRGLRRVGGSALGFVNKYKGYIATLLALTAASTLGASGVMEKLETSFESMLGSSSKAKKMVEDLADFAAKTPFQLTGIGESAKKLLGFGVDGDTVIAKLELLGDIAAGAGVPLGDLAVIYGKTMAKGKAQTEELNQLSERGIPIIQGLVDLAASYGNTISKEDVYKAAEKGQITFEAIELALKGMVTEGGLFHGQMDKQSKTLFGLGSTLKDNVFNNLALVGDKIIETFQIKAGHEADDRVAWRVDCRAQETGGRPDRRGCDHHEVDRWHRLRGEVGQRPVGRTDHDDRVCPSADPRHPGVDRDSTGISRSRSCSRPWATCGNSSP